MAAKKMHPNSLAALEPTKWKKGKAPTGGRPKGSVSITDSLRRNLERIVEGRDPLDKDKNPASFSMREWVGIALLTKAASGDVSAIRELLSRVEGAVTNKMEISGKDGNPIGIEHSARLSEIERRLETAFDSGSGIPLPPPITD